MVKKVVMRELAAMVYKARVTGISFIYSDILRINLRKSHRKF